MSTDLPPVSGVMLAAGASLRFEASRPKQLIDFGGRPLVRRMAERLSASRLRELIVVTGFDAVRVREALEGLEVGIVENPDHASGQSSSVRRGLEAVSAEAAAALFIPVDQPHLDRQLVDRMIELFGAGDHQIIVPAFQGRRAAPVLFSRTLFSELRTIQGDEGGRQLFKTYASRLATLEVDDQKPLLDFDTVEEYRRLLAL